MKSLNSDTAIEEQGSIRSNTYGCSFITEGANLTGFSQVTGPSGMLPIALYEIKTCTVCAHFKEIFDKLSSIYLKFWHLRIRKPIQAF